MGEASQRQQDRRRRAEKAQGIPDERVAEDEVGAKEFKPSREVTNKQMIAWAVSGKEFYPGFAEECARWDDAWSRVVSEQREKDTDRADLLHPQLEQDEDGRQYMYDNEAVINDPDDPEKRVRGYQLFHSQGYRWQRPRSPEIGRQDSLPIGMTRKTSGPSCTPSQIPDRNRECDANRPQCNRIVEDQIIRMWLQKTRVALGRYAKWTAYSVTRHERERLLGGQRCRRAALGRCPSLVYPWPDGRRGP